jgi:hypothetical protein
MILVSQRVENTIPPAKPRLILHAGTPKTGTSTLQVFLHQYHQTLIDLGILYPVVGIEPHAKPPKHQWIVDYLLSGAAAGFLANQSLLLAELSGHPHVHTVVLSTEGIYNHWWDYSDFARSLLKGMDEFFDVSVWVVFREPLSFAKSLYGQILKNPKTNMMACFACYGTADPLERVIDNPYFSRNLRYADFVRSIESLFGRPVVVATKYEAADIITQARGLLGLHQDIGPAPDNVNISPGEIGLDMLRRINKLELHPAKRIRYVDMIKEIDAVIGREDNEQKISAEVKSKVYTIAEEGMAYHKTRYHIDWD